MLDLLNGDYRVVRSLSASTGMELIKSNENVNIPQGLTIQTMIFPDQDNIETLKYSAMKIEVYSKETGNVIAFISKPIYDPTNIFCFPEVSGQVWVNMHIYGSGATYSGNIVFYY
jgi:hypothetical protein